MKKDAQNLLKTKITDLTPEVLSQLEKPLGTSERPFPMWGSQRIEGGDVSDLEPNLSVIADDANPMKVYSDRPYKEVIALAYCDMPVPSMLPLFFDGLERRRPESGNRTQMMIGNPGYGKSFLGALQGRLRSRGPVEVFDCGGKNMNELLFEMVLDFGAGDALPNAIDKRLKAGLLQPLSFGKLKQLPGDAVSRDEDGNVQSIDWNYFKGSAKVEEVEAAFKLMTEVSKIEGLDNAGGNALGMNSQYGPLIRWFLENREGVLDEYNKSREGSDNALQTVWQFLIGEIPSCTVENPLKNKDSTSGPSSFTFRKEDMGLGFFVTLTGNKTEDGLTTRSLNKSVYSRLSPQTLPDPEVADWQHRICQMMVGVPVSTLYDVFKEKAKKDPQAFGEWLLYLRKTKAEIEGVPMPALQETLLLNWQNVLHASEKLAKFYDKWATLTDAEKSAQSDLSMEVDEEYSKKEGIDFRKIKQHLEEAIPIRPRMQPDGAPVTVTFGNWDKPPVPSEKVEENQSLQFGTRLVDFLDRMVYEKTEAVGKHKLYEKLRKAMSEFGLRDLQLKEGERSAQKSVEEDLNISSFADADLTKQAQMARQVFCNYIRQVDPEIVAEDDQIVTIKKLRDALAFVRDKKTAETKEIFIVNRDHETLGASPLIEARIEDTAVYEYVKGRYEFVQAQIEKLKADAPKTAQRIREAENQLRELGGSADQATQLHEAQTRVQHLKSQSANDNSLLEKLRAEEKVLKLQEKELTVEIADLVHQDDFLASLALPTISGKNIAAIWDKNLRPFENISAGVTSPAAMTAAAKAAAADMDLALHMAENSDPDKVGIATTSLRVRYDDAAGPCDVSVHVVLNNAHGKALVVSEKAPSKLLSAFKEAGITYVDRHDPNAQAKVEAALNDLTRNMSDTTKKCLVDAFKYRNDVDVEQYKKRERQSDLSFLSELLANDRIDMFHTKFLVKGHKKSM